MNSSKVNYLIDLILIVLFFIVMSIGLLLYLFMPSGVPGGGHLVLMGLTKATWVWIHSKAGILMGILVVIHFIFHWKWIMYTSKSFFAKGKENMKNCLGKN